MSEQTEKAYQKQAPIFQNKKRVVGKVVKSTREARFVRSIGLGFKTPRDAIEGTYLDKKCPFTGNVSIRGRILTGIVESMKMKRTITIRRDYLHFIKKYQRYEKRHKKLSAHMSPCFRDVALGDLITVGQCRPLSKTVRFNVLKVSNNGRLAMIGLMGFISASCVPGSVPALDGIIPYYDGDVMAPFSPTGGMESMWTIGKMW